MIDGLVLDTATDLIDTLIGELGEMERIGDLMRVWEDCVEALEAEQLQRSTSSVPALRSCGAVGGAGCRGDLGL
mgnify:FL=1